MSHEWMRLSVSEPTGASSSPNICQLAPKSWSEARRSTCSTDSAKAEENYFDEAERVSFVGSGWMDLAFLSVNVAIKSNSWR